MAKSEKKTEASPEGAKSRTGLYIAGAVAAAVIVAGVVYFRDGGAPNPNAPKADPAMAELMDAGGGLEGTGG